MLKLKMMLCVMMLPLVVVDFAHRPVCQSVREATTSGVDTYSLPDWQTPLNRIISPSERKLITAKTAGRSQYINEQCR